MIKIKGYRMHIDNITLDNYAMFSVSNIQKLEYKPDIGMNTILGGNGAGKSKLLLEMTPLPINKKHYENGGKLIVIQHNKSEYILHSTNKSHSFKVDGEEKNANGLISTQTELVKVHFSIDNDIRDLNLGLKRFTNISLAERKKWFTRISITDYTFAIGLFNNLKSTLRDLKGSIKLLNNKNLEVDETTLTAMKTTRDSYRLLKDGLIILASGEDRVILEEDFSYLDSIDILLNNLVSLTNSNLSIEVVEASIKTLEGELRDITVKLEDINIEEDTIDTNEQMVNLEKSINVLEDACTFTLKENIDTIMGYRTIFVNLLDSIKYTVEEYELLQFNTNKAEESLGRLKEKLKLLEDNKNMLDEYKDKSSVECPKCNYTWKVGFNIREYEPLIREIEKVNISIREKEVELKELISSLIPSKESKDAILELNSVLSTIENNNVKELINDAICEPNFMNYINTLYINLENSKLILIHSEELTVLKDKAIRASIIKEKDLELVKETINNLETKLSDGYDTLTISKELLADLKLQAKQKTTIGTYIERTKISIDNYGGNNATYLNKIVKGVAIETLAVLNSKLETLDININRIENDKSILAFTNNKIMEERVRVDVIENLLEELSPDSGIIADSLSSFMHVFISDMNDIINNIWKYELRVLPCSIDEGDLDYIFKVKIPNNTVSDIRELSTGQKEIVDFAFKLTTFSYLKLLDMPIMLDEVFMNLEPKHKELSFKYIDDLIATGTIDQAFMVSHRDESYATIDERTIFLGDSNRSSRLKINN